MEQLSLNELIEKIPKVTSILIVIQDDLTEFTYVLEDSMMENLEDLIREKMGFLFIENDNNKRDYYFWVYNIETKKYNFIHRENYEGFYLHSKLQSELNIQKISGI
jgi:hypothetical protein